MVSLSVQIMTNQELSESGTKLKGQTVFFFEKCISLTLDAKGKIHFSYGKILDASEIRLRNNKSLRSEALTFELDSLMLLIVESSKTMFKNITYAHIL